MSRRTGIIRRCKAKTRDALRCRAAAMPASDFCFFHDPSRAADRQEAQARGGRQNRIKTLDALIPDVKVENCRDVTALLSVTINQVRKGDIDPKIANTVGYLANVMIRAVEQGELESRIAELEAVFKDRSQVQSSNTDNS